jgi:hypothetical protein
MDDMGLDQAQVTLIQEEWKRTVTALAAVMRQHSAFSWQDLRNSDQFGRNYSGGLEGCKSSCTTFLRKSCRSPTAIQNSPLLYQFTGTDHVVDKFQNFPLVALKQDIAMFLLVRGAYAWIGTAWMGPCPWTAGECQHQHGKYQWHTELESNVGTPVDAACSEVSDGVFERRWSAGVVRMDCNRWEGEFPG